MCMGDLEKHAKTKRNRFAIQRAVLGTIATVGLLSVALVMPGALLALKLFGLKPYKRQKEVIARTRNELIKNGCIAKDEKGFLFLTPKGKFKLGQIEHSFLSDDKR